MTVFYRGPCALITHEVFVARVPMRQAFPIRELRRIHIAHTKMGSMGVNPALARAMSIGLAAVIMAVAATKAPLLGASMPIVVGVVLVLLIFTASAGCVRSGEAFELRATYRGQLVCLFQTADELVLGQVSRALLRALECNQ